MTSTRTRRQRREAQDALDHWASAISPSDVAGGPASVRAAYDRFLIGLTPRYGVSITPVDAGGGPAGEVGAFQEKK